MSVHLNDHTEWTGQLASASRELLEHSWSDATKVFSARGLDNYVKGAAALRGLGRGDELVNAWIDGAPQVAREVGEDVVGELATTALMLASKTSGAVIELVLATAPTAARRLADGGLFLQYLQFVGTLVAQAPRGLRPMLGQLDALFGQLTLGGLRRWATWGAQAHRTNYEEQIAYFGLQSKESQAMLQKERKGTLLVDVQRRINMDLRALLDPAYDDTHPWIVQGCALLTEALPRIQSDPHDNSVSWDIGVQLAHSYRELTQGPVFQPRTDGLTAAYRDDNRYFWAFDGFDFERSIAAGYEPPQQVRKQVNLMEFVNELEVEGAGDDAQEIWVLGTELFPYEDLGVSFNESEGREPVLPPVHYGEWDHLIQLERPAWATVQERRPKAGDAAVIDAILVEHRRLIGRMNYILDAMQPQGVQRIRKLEDGDEIDLNAALASLTDLRMGRQPDPRIMMRSVRKTRDISVLVLLDLSQSTNDKVVGQEHTVLDLTRSACALLADAIQKVGDPFAIHGFCSDGRHDVHYWRFKDFNQPYDDLAKARLAGMEGQLSTRMGTAIRHATAALKAQRSSKKLLLVITDGEPADVDVRDPQYLRQDTKKAVEEAGRHGVMTYCMSLDPRADQYVSRIFGASHYLVVDKVERLPEKLPVLYAGLTR